MGCDFWQVDDLQVSIYASRVRLINFRKEVTREYIRQNLFTPCAPSSLTAVVEAINNLKPARLNIPQLTKLIKDLHHGN